MLPAPRVAGDRGRRIGLVILATGALLLGLVVYLVDRPAGSAQLLPAAWHAAHPLALFATLGPVLPDFAHAFALSLLTGLLARTRRGAIGACIAWWLVDTLAELGQAAAVAQWLAAHLPAFLSAYFVRGTFDPGDLLAVALGAALAAALLAWGAAPTAARLPPEPGSRPGVARGRFLRRAPRPLARQRLL